MITKITRSKLGNFLFLLPLSLFFINFSVPKETKVQHPEWSKNATIYEVNIRQYTPEGTFKAFEKYLPDIKDMGIDIIWLMPIHPIGEKNRKGSLGSYYAVKDYMAINPEFGTPEEFKELVKKVHDMGMYVIIDWVANHTAWDNVWTETNPEFFSKDSLGNFYPPVDDWSDVIDLNYENKELWNVMTNTLKFWVEEYNIDGYRCDVAGMVPIEFWEKARFELDKVKPVFMLAEAWEPEHHKAFNMTYNWQLKDVMNDIAQGEKNVQALDTLIKNEENNYPADAYRMAFTTNHDENTWNGTVFERLGKGVEAFAVLTATIEGMPLVYSGQEAGLDKRLSFFDKDTIKWKEHRFRDFYKELFALKKSNKALWNGAFGGKLVRVKTGNDNEIFAFTREKDNNKVFAIFNLSPNKNNVQINSEYIKGKYKKLFNRVEKDISSVFELTMQPWGYKVYYR